MSSSLRATGWRPSVADWGGGTSVVLHRGSNCSLSRAMDGRIMRRGIISSCQSAATSEIVKRCCSSLCKQRYSKYPDLFFGSRAGWAPDELAVGRTCENNSIWVLSGTSSFVKRHSAVHKLFLFTFLCQWVSSTCLSVPTSWIPLNCLETKKHTYLYHYCVYNHLHYKNHRCQCKQMHGNYFWITTALCHLTAVFT